MINIKKRGGYMYSFFWLVFSISSCFRLSSFNVRLIIKIVKYEEKKEL